MEKLLALIVEDEILIAEHLRLRLTALGYEVAAVVSTGEKAVQAALDLRPNFVLMDII